MIIELFGVKLFEINWSATQLIVGTIFVLILSIILVCYDQFWGYNK